MKVEAAHKLIGPSRVILWPKTKSSKLVNRFNRHLLHFIIQFFNPRPLSHSHTSTPSSSLQFLCEMNTNLQTLLHVQSLPPRSHAFLVPAQRIGSWKFTTKRRAFCLRLCNKSFGYGSGIRSSVTRGVDEVEGEGGQKEKQPVAKRAYPFHEIEPKWQRYWEENRTFRTPDEIDTSKPKFYVLDMFPYPRSDSFSQRARTQLWPLYVLLF
jgi:hypothetical protein